MGCSECLFNLFYCETPLNSAHHTSATPFNCFSFFCYQSSPMLAQLARAALTLVTRSGSGTDLPSRLSLHSHLLQPGTCQLLEAQHPISRSDQKRGWGGGGRFKPHQTAAAVPSRDKAFAVTGTAGWITGLSAGDPAPGVAPAG